MRERDAGVVRYKQKVKPGGGKQKGSSFERELCRELSLWVSDGKRDDLLWRSAISGGRATVRAKKGKITAHQAGDICAVHELGHKLTNHFFIECKAYKDLKAATLVFHSSGTIVNFWNICREQAATNDKAPMLVLRQNRFPTLIGLDMVGIDLLRQRRAILCSFPMLDLHLLPLSLMVESEFHCVPQSK